MTRAIHSRPVANNNDGKITILLVLLIVILFSFNAFILHASEGQVNLDAIIQEVLTRNPDLEKMKSRGKAKSHLIKPAGTLPDPKLGFSLSNFPTDTFNFDQEPMTSADIFFTQKFPFPGKLSLKEDIAAIRSKQADLSVTELENLLIYRTKRAYFKLYEVSRFIDIANQTKAVLQEFLGVARQRYAVGKALQKDLFHAQTAVSNIDRRLFKLEKMHVQLVAAINTLRFRPVGDDVKVPNKLSMEKLDLHEDKLMALAEENNPTLARLNMKLDEGKKSVLLARRGLYPDFALTGRYRHRDSRADFVTGAVTLSIPLYSSRKQKEIIRSRSFMDHANEEKIQSFKNALQFSIRDISAELESLNKRISILRSAIIPEAMHTVESALSAYSVGKLEFNSLVSAEIDLFKYETELVSNMAGYNERIAKLGEVVGKDPLHSEVHHE